MKILVTGAGGFLGRTFLQTMKSSEHEIIAMSSSYEALLESYADCSNFSFLHKDAQIPSNIDVVLNCAFPRNEDGAQLADGLEYIKGIFEQCRDTKAKCVINISSQSVYNQQREKSATELTPLHLDSKYAIGKYATEIMLDSICSETKHVNIRLASLVGVGFDQRILNKLIINGMEKDEISVVKADLHYGIMDVRDAAEALKKMCEIIFFVDDLQGVYNLGARGSYTLQDMAKVIKAQIKELCHKKIRVVSNKGEGKLNTALDATLFEETFLWQPRYSLEDSVRDIIEKRQ